ncbi:MAG: hypothetical protein LBP43_02035 [Treponema sp.]|jgi:hypothetical protein|nr:hypothetical protein [Treponema sp.]
MYEHPKLTAFTSTLDALFHEADEILEERWGSRFSLHPNRPRRGATANPEMDGLFEIIPDFTPGIGSQKGRGYLISFRVATLERVPPALFEAFMDETAACIRDLLPRYFPERKLEVARDGKRYKITGDFSLGEI